MNPVISPFFDTLAKTLDPASAACAFNAGELGQGVIDRATAETIETSRLFQVLDTTHTAVGKATLNHSLAHPLAKAEDIQLKQEALRELASNGELAQNVGQTLENAGREEKHLLLLLFGTFKGMLSSAKGPMQTDGYGYQQLKRGFSCVRELADRIANLPAMNSAYLKRIREGIQAFRETREYKLMQGPIYVSERGAYTREDKLPWPLSIRFRPTLFKPVLLVPAMLPLLVVMFYAMINADSVSWSTIPWRAIPSLAPLALPLMLFAMPIVGSLDRDKIIYPLRDNMKKSDALQQVLALFGQLDELLALHRYAQKSGTATVLPDLIEAPQHWLTLQAVRNPILAFENPDYVPNDIKIDRENLLFITGPNSGGKTAFSKTLAQVQLMAQIGSYVPAEKAELCTAQLISYQTPEFNRLGDSEGRFGTELQHTKRIFLATTPRSLVILDEIAEGTTQSERVEIASNVLQGFHKIGNTTILITHNHELVERFQSEGIGCFRQAEFVKDTPTYKLIDGISKVSHADLIANRIGFGKDDIARYLGDKGVADSKP